MPTTQQKITLERTYDAPAEALWELWTTKAGFESWWGPEGFRVEVHVLEPRAGGALSYDMIADAPDAIAAMKRMNQPLSHGTRGRFGEFAPFERLTLVHVIDFVPGSEPYESVIEVDFHGMGDRSRMVVTLHPHRDPHWTKMSIEGFRSQLAKLDKRFGG
ncbi:MAG: SRPBCC domain-containing protein [Polyangiaceae bacterium]